MTTFDMRDYIPRPSKFKNITIQFKSNGIGTPEDLALLHQYRNENANGEILVARDDWSLSDPPVGGWEDTWHYKIDPIRGLIEYRDDFPPAYPGGPRRYYTYVPGKEILWGGVQSVGDEVAGPVEIDPNKSVGIPAGSPSLYGYNYIKFEAFYPTYTNAGGETFNDVVQLYLWQCFCITNSCDGSPGSRNEWSIRYLMAPGLGDIEYHWISEGNRIDHAFDTFQGIAPGSLK